MTLYDEITLMLLDTFHQAPLSLVNKIMQSIEARMLTTDEIQAVIKEWHMKHAGYFISNKIIDDVTLNKAIHAEQERKLKG
jgi:hypothetical protein